MTRSWATQVQAPVAGRAVPLDRVPDPVFAQGMLGHGAAVDPLRDVIAAVAPVGGKVVRLMPHAYVVVTTDGLGVLVHLGLDTVTMRGRGFTTHVAQGDDVAAGQPVVTYDVIAVEADGFNPIVPVVVVDERDADNVALAEAVLTGNYIRCGATLFAAARA